MENSKNFSEYPKVNILSGTAVQREKEMKFRDRDAFWRRLAQSSDSVTAKGSRCLGSSEAKARYLGRFQK
jgi:hypothetical protein